MKDTIKQKDFIRLLTMGVSKFIRAKECMLIVAAILMSAKVSSAQEMITVPLDPFTRISIGGLSKIKLTPGNTNSITFEGREEDAAKIKESVEGGELKLKGRPVSKVNITFQRLESIEIKGTSNVTCTEPIQADKFQIDISGTGDLTLNLNAKHVEVDISGAGNLNLSGSADKLDLEISGAGNVNAEDFRTKICNAEISGTGHCTVDVTDELNSQISGSGSISYKNQPAKINKDISGIGRVGKDEMGNNDTTRFKFGDKNILIISGKNTEKKSKMEKVQPHWAGVEIGFNGYLTPDNKMFPKDIEMLELNQAKSVAVNLNFFDYGLHLYKRYVMFVSGLGLTYNNYRFRHTDFKLANGPLGVYAIPDTVPNTKNKLTVSYVTVPLLLEFNTSKYNKRSFHVSVGGIAGYKLGSHTKHVYHQDGRKVKPKTYDEFSINPWRVDATARIGYRNFNIFANYDLIPLFRTDKGPELHPFTVGLTLVGW